MPVLSAYATQPGAIGVLGVDVQDKPSDRRQLIVDLGIRYPSLSDGDGLVQRALQVPALLPLSFLVSPDGSVRRITSPAVFHEVAEVRTAVACGG